MASRRTLRERRNVNYNEDMLERKRGASKAMEKDLESEDNDRYKTALAWVASRHCKVDLDM